MRNSRSISANVIIKENVYPPDAKLVELKLIPALKIHMADLKQLYVCLDIEERSEKIMAKRFAKAYLCKGDGIMDNVRPCELRNLKIGGGMSIFGIPPTYADSTFFVKSQKLEKSALILPDVEGHENIRSILSIWKVVGDSLVFEALHPELFEATMTYTTLERHFVINKKKEYLLIQKGSGDEKGKHLRLFTWSQWGLSELPQANCRNSAGNIHARCPIEFVDSQKETIAKVFKKVQKRPYLEKFGIVFKEDRKWRPLENIMDSPYTSREGLLAQKKEQDLEPMVVGTKRLIPNLQAIDKKHFKFVKLNNRIFYRCHAGLAICDINNQKVEIVVPPGNFQPEKAQGLATDGKVIYVGDRPGILVYDPDAGKFINTLNPPGRNIRIANLLFDPHENCIWAARDISLHKMDIKSGKWESCKDVFFKHFNAIGPSINFIGSDNKCFICLFSANYQSPGGVLIYHRDEKKWQGFRKEVLAITNIEEKRIDIEDYAKAGNYHFINMWEGLSLYNSEQNKFTQFGRKPPIMEGLNKYFPKVTGILGKGSSSYVLGKFYELLAKKDRFIDYKKRGLVYSFQDSLYARISRNKLSFHRMDGSVLFKELSQWKAHSILDTIDSTILLNTTNGLELFKANSMRLVTPLQPRKFYARFWGMKVQNDGWKFYCYDINSGGDFGRDWCKLYIIDAYSGDLEVIDVPFVPEEIGRCGLEISIKNYSYGIRILRNGHWVRPSADNAFTKEPAKPKMANIKIDSRGIWLDVP